MSSRTVSSVILLIDSNWFKVALKKSSVQLARFEPPTYRLPIRRVTDWATEAGRNPQQKTCVVIWIVIDWASLSRSERQTFPFLCKDNIIHTNLLGKMGAEVVLHHVHIATLIIGDGGERVGPGRDEERLVVVGRHPAEDLSAKGQLVQKVTGLLHWARVLGAGKRAEAIVWSMPLYVGIKAHD